ncbi:hypothetical protein [Virgisporangium aurantiacum]|uniref:Uncharacterized protein n=1 Tax=Virgisporangium aurantiacum TaxID=175570 RepID=A0A8J3ZIG0_9ACTN|nr:hypothetical protein [Virgisporangium aurantiacum]GIJ62120.1 hypothetical protein Vau01_096360 [Virgisporangium aurantiacum]
MRTYHDAAMTYVDAVNILIEHQPLGTRCRRCGLPWKRTPRAQATTVMVGRAGYVR